MSYLLVRQYGAATVFYILSVLLSPVTLLGYVIWVGKALTGGASGVSGTAQGPLSARWFEHNLGTRQDEPANRLMMALPGVPPLGLRLVSGPTLLAHRLTGYVPKAFRYPFEGDVPPQYEASARVAFFDNAVDRYLHDITQFVILGAGFDTRAFRLPKDGTMQLSPTHPMRYDYIVVGAGSAGTTLAARLSEDPSVSVLLLEAGPDYRAADTPPEMGSPNFFHIWDGQRFPQYHWPNLMAQRTTAQQPARYLRGRGLGGSSAVNGMVAIRGIPEDFNRWAELGCRGWSFADVLPAFKGLGDEYAQRAAGLDE
jgi:hypothetical protein